MSRGLAKFYAHFDSEYDRCFRDIFQDDPIAFDKEEQEYICGYCILYLEDEE